MCSTSPLLRRVFMATSTPPASGIAVVGLEQRRDVWRQDRHPVVLLEARVA